MQFFQGQKSFFPKFFSQFFLCVFLSTFVTFYYFGQVLNVKGDYCFQKRLTYFLPFFKKNNHKSICIHSGKQWNEVDERIKKNLRKGGL